MQGIYAAHRPNQKQRTNRPPRCSPVSRIRPVSGLTSAYEMPANHLPASMTQWLIDRRYSFTVAGAAPGLVLISEEHAPASRFTRRLPGTPRSAAKHLTTSGRMLTVAKGLGKLRTPAQLSFRSGFLIETERRPRMQPIELGV
jgi:hypothetical protein